MSEEPIIGQKYLRTIIYEKDGHLRRIVDTVEIWWSYSKSVWAVKTLEFIPQRDDVDWKYITMNYSYLLDIKDFPITLFDNSNIQYIIYKKHD